MLVRERWMGVLVITMQWTPATCCVCHHHIDTKLLTMFNLDVVGSAIVWFDSCRCVAHGDCFNRRVCPNHINSKAVKLLPDTCFYRQCKSRTQTNHHFCQQHKRRLNGILTPLGLNPVSFQSVYTTVMTCPSIVPEHIRESTMPSDVSNKNANFSVIVHPYIRVLWISVFKHIHGSSDFVVGNSTVQVSWKWLQSEIVNDKGPPIVYTHIALLSLVKKRHPNPKNKNLSHIVKQLHYAITNNMCDSIILVDNTMYRRKTKYNCYSVKRLLNCVQMEDCQGLSVSDILLEHEQMPEFISYLVENNIVFNTDTHLYSKGMAALDESLKNRFM